MGKQETEMLKGTLEGIVLAILSGILAIRMIRRIEANQMKKRLAVGDGGPGAGQAGP